MYVKSEINDPSKEVKVRFMRKSGQYILLSKKLEKWFLKLAIFHRRSIPYPGFLLGIFFRGGKIYCYANFYCYSIVFGPNVREGQSFQGGKLPQGAPPCPPVEENQYHPLTILCVISLIPSILKVYVIK